MNDYISKIKSAKKKKFLWGEKDLYKQGTSLNSEDLNKLEAEYKFSFPQDIREFLLCLGSGTVSDFYIPYVTEIYPFDSDNGNIKGFITFASDVLGNYFAFNPNSTNNEIIYYCCHDPLGFGECAKDITQLLKSFVDANFDIEQVTNKVKFSDI